MHVNATVGTYSAGASDCPLSIEEPHDAAMSPLFVAHLRDFPAIGVSSADTAAMAPISTLMEIREVEVDETG